LDGIWVGEPFALLCEAVTTYALGLSN
jgi:hypothetical protein